jgi:GT2 family glycosyltransferase
VSNTAGHSDTRTPTLSVIVPAYRCAGTLREVIAALELSDLPRAAWELIVVDENSPDDTAAVARAHADHVLISPNGPRGPAFARNLGSTVARADVLVFIDADVVVAPTTLSQFAGVFQRDPTVGAVFGAYDQSPRDPGLVSQYRNLLHHYVHSQSPGPAITFWAGCGAVRRDVFSAVGGYDAKRYPRPQIEDIDLKYRMHAAGYRILLAPEIQGKHLKRWTLSSMLKTDLRERAIPWMRLLLERGDLANDGPLNLRVLEKVLTALAGSVVLSLALLVITQDLRWGYAILAACLVIVVANTSMFLWFAKVRGPWFALSIIPLRLLFYFTSGFGAAWAMITHRLQPPHATRPTLKEGTDHAAA